MTEAVLLVPAENRSEALQKGRFSSSRAPLLPPEYCITRMHARAAHTHSHAHTHLPTKRGRERERESNARERCMHEHTKYRSPWSWFVLRAE